MEKTYVFEGKTTNEAIEKGLNELNVSKSKVDIKVLEAEEKRSFFSILAPRVVKVEMTLKENAENVDKTNKEERVKASKKEPVEYNKEEVRIRIDSFIKDFINNLPENNLNYEINISDSDIQVEINGENTGYLIGYRGEVLNSLQTILTNIASKNLNCKVKVLLNIGGYREKRQKDLENLASKIAGSVIKSRKSITLEPMSAYERKIIHLKLQDSNKVQTHSIGEEPYRKVVVSLKK